MERTAGRHKVINNAKVQPRVAVKKGKIDGGFLAVLVTLVVIGLIMVYSASYPSAYRLMGDPHHYLKRQAAWTVLGFGAMFFTMNFDYRAYRKLIKPIFFGTIIILIAVLIVGVEVKGAKRWLGYGSARIQPSELAKITIIIYFADKFTKEGKKIKRLDVLVKNCAIMAVFLGLFLLEPHFSVCIIAALTFCVMLIVAGAKPGPFVAVAIVGVIAAVIFAIIEPYRVMRLLTFMNPEADMQGSGWQITQSIYAIGSGGVTGLGFGKSVQKFSYVSEPQNDFIFAIICEELGLIGAIAIILLFAILILKGMKIAMNAPDTFSSLMVTGIISLVGIQTVLNLAVVTSSIPTTGIPLPFFSAGGSSMLFLMAGMGIILNVSRFCSKKQ